LILSVRLFYGEYRDAQVAIGVERLRDQLAKACIDEEVAPTDVPALEPALPTATGHASVTGNAGCR
jgi:hypothetical protein